MECTSGHHDLLVLTFNPSADSDCAPIAILTYACSVRAASHLLTPTSRTSSAWPRFCMMNCIQGEELPESFCKLLPIECCSECIRFRQHAAVFAGAGGPLLLSQNKCSNMSLVHCLSLCTLMSTLMIISDSGFVLLSDAHQCTVPTIPLMLPPLQQAVTLSLP